MPECIGFNNLKWEAVLVKPGYKPIVPLDGMIKAMAQEVAPLWGKGYNPSVWHKG